MDATGESFVAALQASLRLPDLKVPNVKTTTYSRTVSLLTLCQYTLLEAGIHSFFGKTINGDG